MRNILLTLSYDGTRFSGWQRQEGQITVQEILEKSLTVINKTQTSVSGSGRTDAGVHATGQTANFYTPIKNMFAEKYILALNSNLPQDIRIINAKEVDEQFHARFDATARTYKYFIYCGKTPYAHQLPYVWSIRRFPKIDLLNRMASFLQGEIDCTTFSASGDQSTSKHRYITKAIFYTEGNMLVFEITANAFLWKMIRSLIGTLLYFESKEYDYKYFREVLNSLDRQYAGPTAPPQGLFLTNVSYDGIRRGHSHIKP